MSQVPVPTFALAPGSPSRLGAHPLGDGWVNFAVFSQPATAIDLCLFCNPEHPTSETHRIRLKEKTGSIHHLALKGIPEGSLYGFRAYGPWNPKAGILLNPNKLLLDPYATRINGPSRFHKSLVSLQTDGQRDDTDSASFAPKAFVPATDTYDWGGDRLLQTPMCDSVIMEMHVKGFTKQNPHVPEHLRGTYAGLGHESSVQYLKELGITAVQLLPVHQHLEDGFLIDKGLVNYWGYNTLGFFAPEAAYAATDDPVTEFRDMVKNLHQGGIEVILDVVYNHTCEAGMNGPVCFLRGFDNTGYYHTSPGDPGVYYDVTGCGNSVQVSHPFAMRLVMDSLRYWVEEMHVDGFRFDLAVTVGRDPKGFDRNCGLFRSIQQDPVLRDAKMIAEPWDLGRGGYQLGNFPWNWKELNGKFRDCVRSFWRGDPGVAGEFASRITGSEELFAHNYRTPGSSLNFITSHDGFTLRDLVSYNEKHNEANLEGNRDGDSHNTSYNHGEEGETKVKKIREIRLRQIRNFLATMICSQGVPFLTAGDEAFRTQGGNNNGYCQDSKISWLDWSTEAEAEGLRDFTRRLLAFRREQPALRRNRFFSGQNVSSSEFADVSWLRADGGFKERIDWAVGKAGAFAMMIHRDLTADSGPNSGYLVFFFNARSQSLSFHFPKDVPCCWEQVFDTANPDTEGYRAEAHDSLILEARSLQIWREEIE